MSDHDNAKLLELARHLARGDAGLAEEVQFAIDQPEDYVARFSEKLRYRGILKPTPNLPWIALVNGLQERSLLEEIDWQSPPGEVRRSLEALTGNEGDWAWLDATEFEDKQPDELFPEIEARLADKQFALVAVVMFSDSYPLMVLPLSALSEAQRLAQLAGYGPVLPASESA